MKKFLTGIGVGLFTLVFAVSLVRANHSWNGYHWARTANPFTLKLGDNLSADWKSYLAKSSTDWSVSNILDTTIVTGQGGKNCRATSGRVEVCNRKYGNNGWLGIAQIWVSGSHITQGVTKMNDTYFNTSTYNSPAWRQMVMCQEVGHTFGLDHQDETFDNPNLGTCMDYTNNPSGPPSNLQPNQHDYDELVTIYSHLDSFTTVDTTTPQIAKQLADLAASQNLENPGEWGRVIKDNGKVAVFERDFGFGYKLVTFVVWATN